MLRLLALALLLPTLVQAQDDGFPQSLFPQCLYADTYEDTFQDMEQSSAKPPRWMEVMDPGPFEVWSELAGSRDDSVRECPDAPDADTEQETPAVFYSLDDEGSLLLNAVVKLDGRPLPFAVVIASTRDERDGPIEVAAVGVADLNGAVRMVLPPTQNALRISAFNNRKQQPQAPAIASLVDVEMSGPAHTNSVFVATSEAGLNILMVGPAEPGEETVGPYFTASRSARMSFRRAMRTATAFTMR